MKRRALLWALSLAMLSCLLYENAAGQAPFKAIVTGVVEDEDGKPVASAHIVASPVVDSLSELPQTDTDSAGRFTLEVLTPGDYYLSADKEEDFFASLSAALYATYFDDRPRVPVHVAAPLDVGSVRIRRNAGRLVGVVTDAETGEPVRTAHVGMGKVGSESRMVVRLLSNDGIKGEFSVLIPEAGAWVGVYAEGYEDWYYGADGAQGERAELRLGVGEVREVQVKLRRLKAGS